MSQYIYVLKPVRLEMLTDGPADSEASVLGAHVEYLEQLAASGVFLTAGRTQTADAETFGIVIFKAPTAAEAEEIMSADPAVSNGVMTAKLYPYSIAVVSESILD